MLIPSCRIVLLLTDTKRPTRTLGLAQSEASSATEPITNIMSNAAQSTIPSLRLRQCLVALMQEAGFHEILETQQTFVAMSFGIYMVFELAWPPSTISTTLPTMPSLSWTLMP
jgi:hypothetical protein